jgi:uncharacterized protein YjbJ (UPF0337 family)
VAAGPRAVKFRARRTCCDWCVLRRLRSAATLAFELLIDALEAAMKQSTKDQIKGKFHEVKGKAKEKTGIATNNPRMADQGTDEKVSGVVQKKIGQIEKVFEK